jgi:L1 cell adhesion molecule like protein
MQIINEPSAAALAYSLINRTNCVKNRNILIFDLGGRTFDVSLITLKDDKFEIKAMVETTFGGDDFDQRMVNHFVKVFKRKHKKDISGNSRALRRLTIECERAKRTLSYDTEVTIDIDVICEGIDFCSSITRAKFEQLNMDLFEKCIETIESCLTDANMYKSSVDVVVLVGGSSKIPHVHNLLRGFFGNDVIVNNLTEAVACGAAILAALLSGDLKVSKDVHQYLTRLSLAEQVKGDLLNDTKFHVTIEDNKSNVLIDFQEGVGMTVNVPGSFNISVPHIPRGLPFNVCFGADSDGMLNVSTEVQTVSKDIIITNENVRVELRNPR